MRTIEEIIEEMKEDFEVNRVQTIPLFGGQKQYLINIVTKPTYSREQHRLWSIEDMNNLQEDNFKSLSLNSYKDRSGKIQYYRRNK